MSDLRTELSLNYLSGHGLEIGAFHSPLVVKPENIMDYCDFQTVEELRANFPGYEPAIHHHFIDNAETLDTVCSNEYDYLVANHVLEHCENVLGTVLNWMRVIKENGFLFIAIPEKTQTFDRDRDITKFSHIVDDHITTDPINNKDHYQEYFYHVDKLRDDVLKNAVDLAVEKRTNIHFHVWDKASAHELFNMICGLFSLELVEARDNGAEMIFVLRKNKSL